MRRTVGVVLGLLVALGGLALLPPVGAQANTQAVRAVDVDLVGHGAWVTWSDGRVEARSFGDGGAPPVPALKQPLQLRAAERVVALVPTGTGYWLVTSQGRVARAGDAADHGDLSAIALNDPVVAAAPTASGGGYYMLGEDGGVFTFGDAEFYGSVQGIVDEVIGAGARAADHLTAPIVTLATTPAGYWLVASDGAVFPFGDAPYHGSFQDILNTGNQLAGIRRNWTITPPLADGASIAADALEAPIVDIVPSADGTGYLMLATDGGIFNFGQSQFHGSLAGRASSPAVASDVTLDRNGYAIVTAVGHLHSFGSLLDEIAGQLSLPTDRSTLEALLAEARARRQLVIDELTAKINDGAYGIDSNGVLHGPADFQIDLARDCSLEWSNTSGISSNEIRIGTIWRKNEPKYIRGWTNYLNWVNSNDPIIVDKTPQNIIISQIRSSETAAVGRLLSANIFAAHASPAYIAGNLAVQNVAKAKCVPLAFVNAGIPYGHDPINYPWVTEVSRSYLSEPILWGKYLKEEIAPRTGPLRIVAAVFDGNGASGPESLFERWAAQHPDAIDSLQVSRFEDEPSLRLAMESLAHREPDILFVLLSGSFCREAVSEAAMADLLKKVELAFINSSCATYDSDLFAGARQYSNRWRMLGPDHTIGDMVDDFNEPFWQLMIDNLRLAGLDAANEDVRWGYYIGYPYVEALRIAAALPGGLSRSNFILAVRTLDIYHPLNVDGVPYSLLGSQDAFLSEGGILLRWNPTAESWEHDGLVAADGETGRCVWNDNGQAGFCT